MIENESEEDMWCNNLQAKAAAIVLIPVMCVLVVAVMVSIPMALLCWMTYYLNPVYWVWLNNWPKWVWLIYIVGFWSVLAWIVRRFRG